MSNLGLYQEITTVAKKFGGVEQMIRAIEVGAVTKAAPQLVRKGVGIGIGIGVGVTSIVTAGVATGRHVYSKYKDREVAASAEAESAAEAAKDQLRAIVDESEGSDGPDEGPAGDADTTDSGK